MLSMLISACPSKPCGHHYLPLTLNSIFDMRFLSYNSFGSQTQFFGVVCPINVPR